MDMSDVERYEYLSDSEDGHGPRNDDGDAMHDADDLSINDDSGSENAFTFISRNASRSPSAAPGQSPSRLPHNRHAHGNRKPHRRRKRAPILRAHLLQVKILENHQNGKDTHLRGLQIFARDKTRRERDDVQRIAVNSRSSGIRASGATLAGGMSNGMTGRGTGRSMLGSLGDWGDGPDLR